MTSQTASQLCALPGWVCPSKPLGIVMQLCVNHQLLWLCTLRMELQGALLRRAHLFSWHASAPGAARADADSCSLCSAAQQPPSCHEQQLHESC